MQIRVELASETIGKSVALSYSLTFLCLAYEDTDERVIGSSI